jgi:hypothetical protein
LLLGALIFVLHRAWQDATSRDEVIVLTPALRADLERELTAMLGRQPNGAELAQALETWKIEEILFREGQRLGLNEGDPLVRRRVVTKVLELEQKLAVGRQPSDAELDAWLAEFSERYTEPRRYGFEQVFVSGKASQAMPRALSIARALEGGAQPAGRGDPFEGGTTFTDRTLESLRQLFGTRFADQVAALEVGRWRVVESVHGLHVLKLTGVTEGRPPERERLRPRLVRDWKLAQREIVVELARQKYEDRYVFEEAPR